MLEGDLEPWQEMATMVLPDDLVVEILSRLPLKSFCRFKCVCKSWLSFSSDLHYRQKLPRNPIGLLYQKREHGTSIHLAGLPSGDRDIDTTLSFVPCHKFPLELKDCSNGLILCYHGGIMYSEGISDPIVCNPATQEWMEIPYAEPGTALNEINLKLCFDPLWSQHFYVFKFESSPSPDPDHGTSTEVKVFFSEDSTWSTCLWETDDAFWGDSLFVNGVLYVGHLWGHCLLALEAPGTRTQLLNDRTIQLPGIPYATDQKFYCYDGCLCQSSGVLCYAQQELDGCMLRIWSLEGADRWVVKHRLSVNDVFGRDMLLRTNSRGLWYFDYEILDFDLERELVILVDLTTDKVLSVSISTGEGSEILKVPGFFELYRSLLYVPYYCKQLPASVPQGAQD
ncbi:F-box protein At1g47340-like [Lolium rigidum]|uniref:F-box protein At1g47340-like n=1 Tax=Lolium rigidum TaxID=89674 RepID=UPI001F5D32B5|nr:F-box protein At1g47340-like [Lolium rigidum]